ncbi:hypothetical protein FA13DRAFT_1814094 [Coprinellus micaceus]|uniref:Uncharacterized protein n=1 Tax=Coprinellus micaceus TaxID=71717 RepID=A0A4Y7TBU9_COPMI|nr:hypothetical protein FA13DRAFT_1814094 [Coprinellus micaceus]
MSSEPPSGAPNDLSQFTERERNLLTVIEREKHELEGRKARLQQELEEVETSIIKTQRRYGEIYNARSPTDTLPNEILTAIFRESQQISRLSGVVDNPIAEVTISHVCSHWRRLAMLAPSLWNVFRYDGAVAPQIPLDRLHAYLERSQTHTLDIYLSFTGSGEGWSDQLDMLDTIAPHFSRCRTLQVLSDNDTHIDDFLHKLECAQLPLLEYLSICPDRWHEPPDEYIVSDWNANVLLNGAAPSLKYLRLDSTSLCDFRPPLSSITHLRLEERRRGGMTKFSSNVLDDVFTLPSLETLSIWGDLFFQTGTEYTGASLVEAKRLKHARLEGRKGIVTQYFLSHVMAPALETLTLALVRLDIPLILRDIDLFPSLHTLSLLRGAYGFGPDTLVNFLPFMNITHHIKRFILASPLVQFLAEAMAPPPGSDLHVQAKQIWTKVEEVVINVDSRALELSYKPLIVAFPNMKTLRMNEECRLNIAGDPAWAELQARMKFDIIEFSEGDVLIPCYWPPGPDWMDTEEDPYVFMSTLTIGP